MREIKFRSWSNEEESKMHYFDLKQYMGLNETGQEELCPCNGVDNLMQYTGLKDKNGKEIYEGDILLFNNDYPNAQKMEWECVVKYLKGSFVCEYPKDGVYNHFDSWNVPKVTWEVIGNIYENPELLEGE